MKLVSNDKGHTDYVQRTGVLTINGVDFRPGDEGKATATVTEAQLNLFLHAPGYSIYHDDGTYSGPTGKVDKMIDVERASTRLASVALAAQVDKRIEQMLRDGTLPPTILQALMERAPIVGQTSTAAPGTTTDGTFTVTVQGNVSVGGGAYAVATGDEAVVTSAPAVTVAPAPAETAQEPQEGAAAAQEVTQEPVTSAEAQDAAQRSAQDGQPDMASAESLLTLNRSDLFGMARSFGIQGYTNMKTTDLADEIARAFRDTNEFKVAQAQASGATTLTFALFATVPVEGQDDDRRIVATVDVSAALEPVALQDALNAEFQNASTRAAAELSADATVDAALTFLRAE